MTRPYSWFPLAGSDPVPGDPRAVRAAGERYRTVAHAIRSAAAELTKIGEIDGAVSGAVDAIRSSASEVSDKIDMARGRYAEVGTALVTYSAQLAQAQADSIAALQAAQSAQHVVDQASAQVASSLRARDDAVDPDERLHYAGQLQRARLSRDTGDMALARAGGALAAAVELRDRAARAAISAIEGVTRADHLNDGFWENYGSSIVHAISKIAGTIATVAGILSLVLCWVPGLNAVLGLVALIAGAVALAADLVLLKQGEGSWSDVIWGIVGVASFGAGRVLGVTARAAARGAQGVARVEAGAVGATRISARAAQGLPAMANGQAVINALVGPRIGALARGSGQLGDLLSEAKSIRPWGCSDGWRSLQPRALLRDLRPAGEFLRHPGTIIDAMGKGVDNLRLARTEGGVRPLFAALQGDADSVLALGTLRDIDGAFRGGMPATFDAIRTSNAAVGAWMSGASADAYNNVLGFDATIDRLGGGTEAWTYEGTYDWLFLDSPATQLLLVGATR